MNIKLKTRKELIIEEALDLFSTHGYDGVTVRDIAEAVGIKAPSLYKHFASKSDIFEAIIQRGQEKYKGQASLMKIDGFEPEKDQGFFINISMDQLVEMGKEFFIYFLYDDFMSKIRKMLNIMQYKNKDISKLYTKQFIDDPLAYQSVLFKYLGQEELQDMDSKIMAIHFYSPIFLMFILCDANPEREEEALSIIESHIKQFYILYKR